MFRTNVRKGELRVRVELLPLDEEDLRQIPVEKKYNLVEVS